MKMMAKNRAGLVQRLVMLTLMLSLIAVTSLDVVQSNECLKRRAAFDVGSGSTMLKVADVDICKQKVVKIVYEQQEKVDYREDIDKNNKKFSDQIKAQGYLAFEKLKNEAQKWKVNQNEMAGVATSSFRDSKNSSEFLTEIKNKLGLNIHIISQEEEGQLGFYSTLAAVQEDKDNIIAWDIGGGSMQITGFVGEQLVVHLGDLASVSFKNQVLSEILKSKSDTPNPMSVEGAQKSVSLARSHAKQNLNKLMLTKINQLNGKVFGIGSVHGKSIRNQVNKTNYNSSDVYNALQIQSLKSDKDIGGKYASTDVTNLALISGYMSAYGIREVQIVNVNNADGVLINPKYWLK